MFSGDAGDDGGYPRRSQGFVQPSHALGVGPSRSRALVLCECRRNDGRSSRRVGPATVSVTLSVVEMVPLPGLVGPVSTVPPGRAPYPQVTLWVVG